MILTFKKKDGNGDSDFNVSMSEAELNFLVNFAIQSLVQIGIITANSETEEPQEVMLPITETVVPPTQVN